MTARRDGCHPELDSGSVEEGILAYTDPVVRQAHQPVQGDRTAVIPGHDPESVEGGIFAFTDAVVRQAHQPVQGDGRLHINARQGLEGRA